MGEKQKRRNGVELTPAEVEEMVYSLTPEQEKALESLLSGKNITAAAAAAGLARQTVSGWVNHDPIFIAAYNRRRQQLNDWFDDRLRSLAEQAFTVVEEEMAPGQENRLAAARIVLRSFLTLRQPPSLTTPQGVENDQKRKAYDTTLSGLLPI